MFCPTHNKSLPWQKCGWVNIWTAWWHVHLLWHRWNSVCHMITGTVIFIYWGTVCSRRAQLYKAVPRAVSPGELMKRALMAGIRHTVCRAGLLTASCSSCCLQSSPAGFQGLHQGSPWQHCQPVSPLLGSPLLAQCAASWAGLPVLQLCYLILKTNGPWCFPVSRGIKLSFCWKAILAGRGFFTMQMAWPHAAAADASSNCSPQLLHPVSWVTLIAQISSLLIWMKPCWAWPGLHSWWRKSSQITPVFSPQLSLGLCEKERGREKETLLYQFLSHLFLGEMSSGGSQHSSLPRHQLAEKSYCCQIPSLPREHTGRSEDRERIRSRELKQKVIKLWRKKKKWNNGKTPEWYWTEGKKPNYFRGIGNYFRGIGKSRSDEVLVVK